MTGPDVVWYRVSAFLFFTGAFGVLIRRSPLIVLLAGDHAQRRQPALIAFARYHGRGDGQIFALTVMAVAASEVVVGLGLIVAMSRRKLDLDVDKLRDSWAVSVIVAAWICLLTPLGATLAITLAGGLRAAAPATATGSVAVSWRQSSPSRSAGDSPDDRSHSSTLWHWLTGPYQFNLQILVDPLGVHDADRRRVGCLIVGYSIGHGRRRRGAPLLRLHGLFVFSMLLPSRAATR
jgi:NADH-quinone oxidoreductase subunit K